MTLLRKICVVLAALAAVALSQFHQVTGLGLSQAEFAAKSDGVLRAAGYAFAVWGLLYLGMLVYTVFQFTRKGDASRLAGLMGWSAAAAFLSCGAWVVASSLDIPWLTVVIILIGAVALNERLVGAAGADARSAGRLDRWLVLWPLAALAGWLTIATALNIVTVASRYGWLDTLPAVATASVAVLAASGVSLFVAHRTRSLAHPLLVAWGLAAVAVAESAGKPLVAAIAGVAAALLLAGGLYLSRRPHRRAAEA